MKNSTYFPYSGKIYHSTISTNAIPNNLQYKNTIINQIPSNSRNTRFGFDYSNLQNATSSNNTRILYRFGHFFKKDIL